MNIGETGATVSVIDLGTVAAAAAPPEGASRFADKLAEALGPEAAPAKGAGAAVEAAVGDAPLADASAAVAAALLAGLVAKPLTAAAPEGATKVQAVELPDVMVESEGKGALPADAAVIVTGEAVKPEVELPSDSVPEPEAVPVPVPVPVALAGADPVLVGADAVDTGGAAEVVGDAGEEAVTSDAPKAKEEAAAVPVPVAAAVVVPVAVPMAAPAAVAVSAEGDVAARPAAARAVSVALPVPVAGAVATGFAAVDAPVDTRSAKVEAKAAVKPDAAGEGADAPVGLADAVAPAKTKDLPALATAEPVAVRVGVAAVAAPLVAAKPVVVEDNLPDPAGPLMGQPVQPGVPTSERMVAQPLRTDLPGWEQVLTERIAAELSGDGQEIELTLAPEKLGPLRIKLEMVDGLAQVRFITATPEAARVFTEAQHRLTEGLARAGIDLGSQSARSEGQGGGQGGATDDRSGPRGRMTEFLTRSHRIEAGDAAVLRRAATGLVNLMA